MTPGNLPFEYPFRWRNEDLAKMAGVTTEAAALLEQRDRDLEDYLAGLDTGGGAEHFRYIVPDYRTTATTATFETVALSSAATGAFASAGVSLASNVITLPVGKWLLGITVETTYWSGLPAAGDFHMGFDVTSPYHPWLAHLRYTDYDWTGSAPTFSGSNLYDITESDQTVRVYHFTDSGETSSLYGMVWGHQIA